MQENNLKNISTMPQKLYGMAFVLYLKTIENSYSSLMPDSYQYLFHNLLLGMFLRFEH